MSNLVTVAGRCIDLLIQEVFYLFYSE